MECTYKASRDGGSRYAAPFVNWDFGEKLIEERGCVYRIKRGGTVGHPTLAFRVGFLFADANYAYTCRKTVKIKNIRRKKG